jgi:beta-aspartyl-dipeptidase (metallo-type)
VLVKRGCTIDITAFPESDDEPGLSARHALVEYMESGLPMEKVTISSDGGGCLPVFNEQGMVTKMDVGDSAELALTLKGLLNQGYALERILPAFTSNVADLLRLDTKGRIQAGSDADLAILDEAHSIWGVMAKGVWHKKAYEQLIYGTFEKETK